MITQIENTPHYPKKLTAEITAFNAEVEEVTKGRDSLQQDAADLRNRAAIASIGEPEKLPAMVDGLRGRQCSLDVQELRLIGRKAEFLAPIHAARAEEKKRLDAEIQSRTQELTEGLKKLAPENRYLNGIINEDAKLRELKGALGSVSQYLHVVTDEEEERGKELSARLASLIPTF